MSLFDKKNSESSPEVLEKQPTSEELFNDALLMLNQEESIHLRAKGKEQLRILAEDSLYLPAQMKYYVMILNSKSPQDVQKGFAGLEQIAHRDPSNNIAQFECGLTLSKGNSYFEVPTIRQNILNINMDLERTNQFLYKSMNADTMDYKSPYWALSNLIEMKLAESNGANNNLPLDLDKQMIDLYNTVERRIQYYEDVTAEKYKKAIITDKKILWNWGLLK